MVSAPNESPSEEWLDRFCRRFTQLRPADDSDKCLQIAMIVWGNLYLLPPETAAEVAAEIMSAR